MNFAKIDFNMIGFCKDYKQDGLKVKSVVFTRTFFFFLSSRLMAYLRELKKNYYDCKEKESNK